MSALNPADMVAGITAEVAAGFLDGLAAGHSSRRAARPARVRRAGRIAPRAGPGGLVLARDGAWWLRGARLATSGTEAPAFGQRARQGRTTPHRRPSGDRLAKLPFSADADGLSSGLDDGHGALLSSGIGRAGVLRGQLAESATPSCAAA